MQAWQQGGVWDEPVRVPSPDKTSSWFPDLAVDSQHNVYVVWSESDNFVKPKTNQEEDKLPESEGIAQIPDEMKNLIESVYLSMWDGRHWSQYIDLVPPQADISRTALTIDGYDNLHLLYGATPFGLFYSESSDMNAFSASAWSAPALLNENAGTYYSDMAVYGDKLYVVYDDAGLSSPTCINCGDIYFRYSPDLGKNWSIPLSLRPSNIGSSRSQIEVDQYGRVYVTWDEGWDRLSGVGVPDHGIFMWYDPEKDLWSDPKIIDYPASSDMQLTVGVDGEGGILLVWRTSSSSYPGIYYLWSSDFGETWSVPQTIPNIYASSLSNYFDVYDMATDSAGHIHLLAAGIPPADLNQSTTTGTGQDTAQVSADLPGLYHLEWDGERWSIPIRVYRGGWYPEYPRLVIDDGNQMYATWFLRQDLFEPNAPHQVWFAHGQLNTPYLQKTAMPTLTPTSAEENSQVSQVIGQDSALLDPQLVGQPSESDEGLAVYTEVDDYLMILKGLIPATLFLVVVMWTIRRHRNE
ncbi:MAG: exo-alpha-sialidase [Chloroflexi bacterium]|nr:exo-alpha-sialidase [Chloroflexota bacterium]